MIHYWVFYQPQTNSLYWLILWFDFMKVACRNTKKRFYEWRRKCKKRSRHSQQLFTWENENHGKTWTLRRYLGEMLIVVHDPKLICNKSKAKKFYIPLLFTNISYRRITFFLFVAMPIIFCEGYWYCVLRKSGKLYRNY